MSYTELTLHAMRKKVAAELLVEVNALRAEEGVHPIPALQLPMSDIEQRLQTLVMAGVGTVSTYAPSTSELLERVMANKTTSQEVASIASQYMDHDDLNVRKLAASALSQS